MHGFLVFVCSPSSGSSRLEQRLLHTEEFHNDVSPCGSGTGPVPLGAADTKTQKAGAAAAANRNTFKRFIVRGCPAYLLAG